MPITEQGRLFGRNIRNGRKKLKMPQTRLAEIVETTQQAVSSWESGRAIPRDRVKIKIADALYQDVHQMFPLVRPRGTK